MYVKFHFQMSYMFLHIFTKNQDIIKIDYDRFFNVQSKYLFHGLHEVDRALDELNKVGHCAG